jgi:CRP-like cAMP-binding protein
MTERLPAIFDGIPHDQLVVALRRFRKGAVQFGTLLIDEGEEDPSLLCILDGEVEIRTGGIELGRAGPGSLVGEMALFGEGLRTASVKSIKDTSFLMLDRGSYEAMRDEGHPIAKAIEDRALEQLTARLRATNQRIAKLAEGTRASSAVPSASIARQVAKLFGGGGSRGWALGADKVALLRKSPLFRGTEEALQALAAQMGAASFATGQFLCTQGEYGREMFVVGEGLVEVVVALDEDRVEPLATLDAGDVFGMSSMLEDMPRSASCVARGKVIALTLDGDAFRKLIGSQEPAGSLLRTAVIRGLVDQLAYANGQLAMLDIERRAKTGEHLTPLLRAKASMEAKSQTMTDQGGEG